jgi:hypothetical protein
VVAVIDTCFERVPCGVEASAVSRELRPFLSFLLARRELSGKNDKRVGKRCATRGLTAGIAVWAHSPKWRLGARVDTFQLPVQRAPQSQVSCQPY